MAKQNGKSTNGKSANGQSSSSSGSTRRRSTGSSAGACLLEDPDYQTRALTESQRNQIETLLMSHFARASRGVDGWQQDKLNESVQTKRVEDNRREQQQGGLIGGLFD